MSFNYAGICNCIYVTFIVQVYTDCCTCIIARLVTVNKEYL